MLPQALLDRLQMELGLKHKITNVSPVGGGSINHTYRITAQKDSFFAKVNDAHLYPGMFKAEAKGLELLRKNSVFRIPEVHLATVFQDQAILVLEFLKTASTSKDMSRQFGAGLAEMHRKTSTTFGLKHNNFIGSLPQSNAMHKSWTDFFVNERLEPQVKMARESKLATTSMCMAMERLYHRLASVFPEEPPAFLHGDLWSGNYMVGPNGHASLFDPAVYYGHREMDIGMTKLFGGFEKEFYESYHQAYPLEADWKDRTNVANLYPLLVHVNLFGGQYLAEVKQILARFT